MKLQPFSLIVLTTVLLSACSQAPTPAPVKITLAPPPPTSAAPGVASAPAPAFTPDVSGTAVAPYQRDLASKSPDEQVRGLNGVLSFWLDTGRPFPQDLNEFVAAKLMPRLPTPPPGKQFVLDAARRQVVLSP